MIGSLPCSFPSPNLYSLLGFSRAHWAFGHRFALSLACHCDAAKRKGIPRTNHFFKGFQKEQADTPFNQACHLQIPDEFLKQSKRFSTSSLRQACTLNHPDPQLHAYKIWHHPDRSSSVLCCHYTATTAIYIVQKPSRWTHTCRILSVCSLYSITV